MRSDKKKHLLVEGEADQRFFGLCLQRAQLAGQVGVGPPMSYGAQGSGKGNAISLLPTLLKQLETGEITHLALIVDADAPSSNGLGFQKTVDKVYDQAKSRGYQHPKRLAAGSGYRFTHPDGLPDLGLWVMPDNASDGFLEDFMLQSAHLDEAQLIADAKKAVSKLASPKFPPHHRSKADAATWLAWQEKPGRGLHGSFGGNLIDWSRPPAKPFEEWLKAVFL